MDNPTLPALTPTLDGFNPERRPLCPFCSAPWTNSMISIEDDASFYDSCTIRHTTLTIACETCERVIYEKDISESITNG